MSLFDFFRKNRGSAPAAKERLQIILAHERGSANSDLLVTLREEILAVVAKHMPVERDRVHVKMDRNGDMSLLEVDVELPIGQDGNETLRLASAG